MVSARASNEHPTTFDTQDVYTRLHQVAVERIAEYTDELAREPPEFINPRPPASWPENGAIKCEDLVIRYAVSSSCYIENFVADSLSKPDLPNVLHSLNFDIKPGEKVFVSNPSSSPHN
jgi:ABC-type multidrug transport system fused ATPase/permease subunit